jgi:hypothetical protein
MGKPKSPNKNITLNKTINKRGDKYKKRDQFDHRHNSNI